MYGMFIRRTLNYAQNWFTYIRTSVNTQYFWPSNYTVV
jgi:hypothetical protein